MRREQLTITASSQRGHEGRLTITGAIDVVLIPEGNQSQRALPDRRTQHADSGRDAGRNAWLKFQHADAQWFYCRLCAATGAQLSHMGLTSFSNGA